LVAQGAGREAMSGRSAPAGFGSAAVKALLADLAGDWTTAQRAYLALDQPAGAALAACRLGDRRLQQGDLDGALFLYTQAADLWDQEDDGCGLALARYRQAEALWRKEDAVAAQAALRAAQSWLETARLASEDDRQVVQRALATGRLGDWTPWRWQRYDDALRASVMVQP
jgi:tetratricopeptide (TPR) repeat protein